MTVTLTLVELAAIVFGAVLLAVLDGASLSRLLVAAVAKKIGASPTALIEETTGDEEDGDA